MRVNININFIIFLSVLTLIKSSFRIDFLKQIFQNSTFSQFQSLLKKGTMVHFY